jgi:DNA-binding transcriptional LysR family regulator
MKPTPWALELSGPISRALSDIENALDGATFDPATSGRAFTIATPDYATITLMPRLLELMQKEAPGVVLQTVTPSLHFGEYLDTQQADIALLNWPNPPERFVSQPLFEEDWVCVMRPNHPLVSREQTLDNYASASHLLISPQGEPRNWIDDALEEAGRKRRVAYTMPTYGPAPLILERTDLLLTCPKSVGDVFQKRNGMLVSACPLKPSSNIRGISMVWHSGLGQHPAYSWLRGLLRTVGNTIGE